MRTGSVWVWLAAVAVLGACGDSSGPANAPGLNLVSGAGAVDTIGAELDVPLVVRLLDESGAPLAGREIVFQPRDCISYYNCSVFVASVGDTRFVTGLVDSTDEDGYARTRIKLGLRAGEGRLRISAGETQQVVAASYTIAPGQPVLVHAAPRDSTLHVGASYTMRGATSDRGGNPRAGDPIRFARVDGPISVDPDGSVRATGIGRARLVAWSGEQTDTAYVSVVPEGRLAVTLRADNTEVRTVDLDGSGLTTVVASGWWDGGRAAWVAGGASLVFVQGGAGSGTLRVSDGGGASHRLAPSSTAADEQLPRVSRDGEWAYFRYSGPPAPGSELWRVRLDGSGLERIGPAGEVSRTDGDPDPSPDGGRLAYATTRPDGISRLVVRDLAGGTDAALGLPGRLPRWSPAGDRLAYWHSDDGYTGTIHLALPDGSGDRGLSPSGRTYEPVGLDWSPDGAWLIARGESTLELIDVASGATMPLGWSAVYAWPAWKPQ
jgi:hypothetical protein